MVWAAINLIYQCTPNLMIHIHPDPHAAEWILEGRAPLTVPFDSQDWTCRVKNLVPTSFERYVKVLHTLEADYSNIDNPLTDEENGILKIPKCEKVRGFVERHRSKCVSKRFSWKEIAEWLQVPYESEINHDWFVQRLRPHSVCWPRYISGPSDGLLDPEERGELVRILRPHTRGSDFSFRFSPIPTITSPDTPLLFEGQLEELESFLVENHYQFGPEYWWSSDKTWCVCSDYDLTFTIIGGPAALIEDVLCSEILEAIPLTESTRVDSRIPLPKR